MKVYLAGAVSGNLTAHFRENPNGFLNIIMKIYLAGTRSRPYVFDYAITSGGTLAMVLSSEYSYRGGILSEKASTINVLESFYTVDACLTKLIPQFNSFMLDSGAFSLFSGKKRIKVDEYINRYIEYINANDVKLFFELDIDKIIGYDKVKEIRRRLERETGKCPIPVWHKHLGKAEFLRMCDEYDYVAIGGIVSKEISITEYKYLPYFINEAHKRGAKIHGLGFTNMKWLPICHFDSVDSTSWTIGNRFGYIWKFDGRTMIKISRPPNTRVKNIETALNNFVEWLKFADYAERNL